MQRWSPCSSNSQRAAQPEPSPSPAFHHLRHRDWLWHWHPQPVWHWRNRPAALVCCGCGEGVGEIADAEGLLSVSPATLPCPHCLTLALALTFSLPRLTKPSSLRLVSPRPPLSSDFPGSQGCTLCSELGSSTRTAFLSFFAKIGLYGQARRRTAPQYPSEKESTDIRYRCTLAALWGRSGSSAPFLPWSVDSGGQPPQSQISLFLRLVVACTAHSACCAQSCRVLRVEAGPSCALAARTCQTRSGLRSALARPGCPAACTK